ncbi:Cd(II)/Pb(II)-responsive transcriptional regulator [Piscinibacter terrae]|uniref:Cd(II)/Pb(II)-responsive transcriptional regulator n=1 Tax=Piscinibacter terrae TaxID=2496871 RepID=A0A3N7JL01_9BURK|nr:Cd(II)/Pb(II)-responsive transcriptional regulator [Albitalea terrae]RQP21979.1 Cd(II)/Pb(II)-responsive transcriptional regulator [Albitalea terrae]
MKIGELSRETGTAIETIRFYEREALLPAPQRTGGNFRVYEKGHAERLAFIRHCRSLDMTLDEVRVLLDYKDAPERSCGEVNELLDAHIGHVAARIKELRTLEKHLKALRQQCGDARSGVDCGILDGISAAARSPATKPSTHVRGTHRETRALRG